MLGVVLIVAGLLLWLLAGFFVLGIILIVLGVILLFVPWPWAGGYGYYRGRRPPP